MNFLSVSVILLVSLSAFLLFYILYTRGINQALRDKKNNINQRKKRHISLDSFALILCLASIGLIFLYLTIDYSIYKRDNKSFDISINENITLFDYDRFISDLDNQLPDNKRIGVCKSGSIRFYTNKVGEIEDIELTVYIPRGKDYMTYSSVRIDKGKLLFKSNNIHDNISKQYELHQFKKSLQNLKPSVLSSIYQELNYNERLSIEIGFRYEENFTIENKNILDHNGEITRSSVLNYTGYYLYIRVGTVTDREEGGITIMPHVVIYSF